MFHVQQRRQAGASLRISGRRFRTASSGESTAWAWAAGIFIVFGLCRSRWGRRPAWNEPLRPEPRPPAPTSAREEGPRTRADASSFAARPACRSRRDGARLERAAAPRASPSGADLGARGGPRTRADASSFAARPACRSRRDGARLERAAAPRASPSGADLGARGGPRTRADASRAGTRRRTRARARLRRRAPSDTAGAGEPLPSRAGVADLGAPRMRLGRGSGLR
jgi:hypothetical protein